MESKRCAECGATVDVRPARDYPDLAALLKDWGSLEAAGGELLCPDCAESVSDEMRGSMVRICRLDPSKPGGGSPRA